MNAKGAKGAKFRKGRVEVVIDEGVSPLVGRGVLGGMV